MSSSIARPIQVRAQEVRFDTDMMHVRLLDGREVSVPLEWFPTIRAATEAQRNRWTLIGKGIGIRWEDLDEDLSVAGLLQV